jgi:transcriptional regulator with XRE-family HTH domain
MNNVRECRKSKKMSLQQVASAAGTSKSYIYEIERFTSTPNVQLAYRIAKALRVPVTKAFPPITEG